MSLLKRALRGFTQQLGDSNEKSLDASLFMMEVMHHGSKSEEIRIFENFARKCKDTLGEDSVITLESPNSIGIKLKNNGEYEKLIHVLEGCLAVGERTLGVDHRETVASLGGLGNCYSKIGSKEKAFEYYERALEGHNRCLGRTHPDTLLEVYIMASYYLGCQSQESFEKAVELNERVLAGCVNNYRRDHHMTKTCAKQTCDCHKYDVSSLK